MRLVLIIVICDRDDLDLIYLFLFVFAELLYFNGELINLKNLVLFQSY